MSVIVVLSLIGRAGALQTSAVVVGVSTKLTPVRFSPSVRVTSRTSVDQPGAEAVIV